MTIQLSEQRQQLVLSLLRAGKFASADDVIDEGLRLVEERLQVSNEMNGPSISDTADGSADRTTRQLGNLRRLGQKLDAMPTVPIADGMSNQDHDRMIYGK
jgi:Arc/MetJ-type ribon-helix-helix transcriptional regulator